VQRSHNLFFFTLPFWADIKPNPGHDLKLPIFTNLNPYHVEQILLDGQLVTVWADIR